MNAVTFLCHRTCRFEIAVWQCILRGSKNEIKLKGVRMSVAGTVESEQQFDQFIFQRELNEVYLLIDYLSGRPDKTLVAFDNIALADLDAESRLGQLGGADPPGAVSAGGLPSETTPDLLKT